MAEKLLNFFKKKVRDAEFKFAGPGQTLGQSAQTSTSSMPEPHGTEGPYSMRKGPSEESKIAAERALARLQQQKPINPNFNTSAAVIRSKAKKSLDEELKSSEPQLHPTPKPSANEVEVPEETTVPDNYAVSGLYFKCPLVSNAVLPKEEWRCEIKKFLYEQLEGERGLSASLIIQNCNSSKEKIDACVSTLSKYLENIIRNPTEEKYHKIRLSNKVFQERVKPVEGALDILEAAGFKNEMLKNDDGTEEEYLVFDIHSVPSFDTLTTLIDYLQTAEPIALELDRNVQVFLPDQNTKSMELPPSFYSLSLVDVQKEASKRANNVEKLTTLRTKAMRDADEKKVLSRRIYKYAVIRVRFPDGVLLQGTFNVTDTCKDIYEFVKDNLEYSENPFSLLTATGHKLKLDLEGDNTLTELELVPAAILTFEWSSVPEEVKNKYLKPDILCLAREHN